MGHGAGGVRDDRGVLRVGLGLAGIDDALDLLEVLIATKLLAKAERETVKEKIRTLPRVEHASAKPATVFQVVFDTTAEQADTDTGEVSGPKVASFEAMWEQIEAVVSRNELAAAIAALFELTPPLDSDVDEAWRSMLVTRFGTVRPFSKPLVKVVDFGATPEGMPVLTALQSLPGLMGRKKVGPAEIDAGLLVGSWRRLVLAAPHLEPGTVDWKAYVFCVLEQFHRTLRRREVFARNCSKWGDPRAKLLAGEAWEQAKPTVLASLGLPAGVDLARIERHWEDILRFIGSIHTGAVRAYDVIRMLSREGRPTPLGDAIAHYGRIAKTLHILRLADEPGHRRQIKVQANLQEGRHALTRKIFHGRAGRLYQCYRDGMEDQIGALGLVLSALVLFDTRYMDAVVAQLRADGHEVRDEDVARLSPFVRHHVNMLGRYSFQLLDLPGGLRPLRDKNAADGEEAPAKACRTAVGRGASAVRGLQPPSSGARAVPPAGVRQRRTSARVRCVTVSRGVPFSTAAKAVCSIPAIRSAVSAGSGAPSSRTAARNGSTCSRWSSLNRSWQAGGRPAPMRAAAGRCAPSAPRRRLSRKNASTRSSGPFAVARASASASLERRKASSVMVASRAAEESKYWYTLERARPARAPTAAGVTAAAPSFTRMSIAAPISASRCWARCSATVEALIFGMRDRLLAGGQGRERGAGPRPPVRTGGRRPSRTPGRQRPLSPCRG